MLNKNKMNNKSPYTYHYGLRKLIQRGILSDMRINLILLLIIIFLWFIGSLIMIYDEIEILFREIEIFLTSDKFFRLKNCVTLDDYLRFFLKPSDYIKLKSCVTVNDYIEFIKQYIQDQFE